MQNRTPLIDHGWIRHGIIGGLVAGLALLLFQSLMAGLMGGWIAVGLPVRMVGAMAIGPEALSGATPLADVLPVGLAIHFGLSMLFGLILAGVGSRLTGMAQSRTGAVVAGGLYGTGLWLVNYYLIAPRAGWSWFAATDPIILGFIAHTFAFGLVLGLYLSRVAVSAWEALPEGEAVGA